MNSAQSKQLKLTLLKSVIGRTRRHRACVRGLGLRHTRHSVVVNDTPEIRGMIGKVADMLTVEEV
jgi:large subunit ribosomal protein L30